MATHIHVWPLGSWNPGQVSVESSGPSCLWLDQDPVNGGRESATCPILPTRVQLTRDVDSLPYGRLLVGLGSTYVMMGDWGRSALSHRTRGRGSEAPGKTGSPVASGDLPVSAAPVRGRGRK
jgi:hypothetical protein